MKKNVLMLTMLLFTASMSLSAPMSALSAQSPTFARSNEEWESLKDNKLEYSEIADLVHEYNPDVISNNYDYKSFVDTYGTTNEEIASEYRSKATELLNNISGSDDATSVMSDAQAELQAKQLNQSADNNTDDSTTKSLSYAMSEAKIVMNAKSSFIAYYSALTELESAKTRLESLKADETLTAAKAAAGTVTDKELRAAQKSVSEQESAVKKAEESIEETRQKLIVMLGWKSTDTPEIGELPEVTAETVNAIDINSDLKKAEDNNYTLKINKRKLENASDSDNISVLKSTIDSNERSISVSVNSAYSSLKTALLNLETAQLELSNAEKNMSVSEAGYSAGLISKYEYTTKKSELEEKKAAVTKAKCSLISAYMTYESYVGGLADAG